LLHFPAFCWKFCGRSPGQFSESSNNLGTFGLFVGTNTLPDCVQAGDVPFRLRPFVILFQQKCCIPLI
jgi:hypothetical protein